MIKRHADDVTIDYIIRLRKLEQENERFREALREIADNLTPDKYDNEICLETHCGDIARAALKESE